MSTVQQALMVAQRRVFSTWNPSDKNSNLLLSGGDLLASVSASNNASGRGTVGVSVGAWQWEVTVNTKAALTPGFGIATSAASLASGAYIGQDAYGWAFYPTQGLTAHNATYPAYGSGINNGDVFGICLDIAAGTLIFYRNGTSLGTAYSGLSGTFYPAITCANPAEQSTLSTGASSLAYPVSGYIPGPSMLN